MLFMSLIWVISSSKLYKIILSFNLKTIDKNKVNYREVKIKNPTNEIGFPKIKNIIRKSLKSFRLSFAKYTQKRHKYLRLFYIALIYQQ